MVRRGFHSLFVKEFGKALALGLVNYVMREVPDVLVGHDDDPITASNQ